jgi:hypothetical protein
VCSVEANSVIATANAMIGAICRPVLPLGMNIGLIEV